MAKASVAPGWQRALIVLTGTVIAVIVFVCLYWAQTIFMPVALAINAHFARRSGNTPGSALRSRS